MATKRKTVKDWRKSYADATARLIKVENDIKQRLLDLTIANPSIPVASRADSERTIIKASSLSRGYVEDLTTPERLMYIEIIEKYLADQHPHQQQTLFIIDKAGSDPKPGY
jgi:hypothetical protein